MGKKRVFEIARELGYQNRDLIEKLQKLGIEVKSHSSTVDEDEVRRALRKAEEERRAKTQESRVSRGVIRRRPIDEMTAGAASGGHAPATLHEGTEAPPLGTPPTKSGATVVRRRAAASARAAEEPKVEAKADALEKDGKHARARETSGRHAPPVEVESEAPTEDIHADEHDTDDLIRAGARAASVHAEAGSARPEAVSADEAETGDVELAEAEQVGAPDDQNAAEAQAGGEGTAEERDDRKERREARTARPDRKREETFDEDDDKPELDLEELGISVSDFSVESFDRPMEAKGTRVAPPPPSTTVAAAKKEEETQTKIVRTIDPSVLKARLSASKRPEPPKEWGKSDEIAASPVTELVVRTDASGKRKELIDVRKEAARGKGGKSGQRRREEMSAKDLLEHRRGQVYYPTPGRKRIKSKRAARKMDTPQVGSKKPIEIGEKIAVGDLAKQMSRKVGEVIQWLMQNGIMATINQSIEYDVAATVAQEFGYEVQSTAFNEEEHLAVGAEAGEDPNAKPRPPVVTVMGHVDHGKTSLLDKIRSTNVAAGEAGGITQRIAGYQVRTSKGPITFLDTPGHAAFTAMRARGANVTDIVILVVAADDGVMPQTVEAIELAKAAEVPIIVALNKIDKPEANPDKVLQQLSQRGILTEEWGGEVLSRKVSARTGDGIEELLEQIALQAEIMELKANPDVPAVGVVVESELHKGRGPVATILVQEGTLRIGDIVIAGEATGKVRAMMGDAGRKMNEAGPSTPAQITGLDGVPNPGEELRVAASLEAAKTLAEHRREKRRATEMAGTAKVSLQDLFARASTSEQKELKIIIKADLQGSVEALKQELSSLSTQKVRVSVIQGSVGAIVESDVEYAKAAEAIIVGFAVRPDTKALKAARAMDVEIRTYSIIYEAVNDVKDAMRGMLSPISKERYLGRAEVRQTFNVPKVGTVAGCAVVDGVVTRSAHIRLLRDSKPVYTGKLASLKHFKDDVREVQEGKECGMGIDKFNDVKIGDVIEAYEIVLQEAVLDEAIGPQDKSPTPPEARP
jgi:translation initiation factor IF-2